MSLEHSPARQRTGALRALLTREEVAARYRATPAWVTRNYRRLGWKPVRYGKRILFPEDQLAESDRKMLGEF